MPPSSARWLGRKLDEPINHIVGTPDGGGYWLVASDGGDLHLRRRTLLRLHGQAGRSTRRSVDLAPTPDGRRVLAGGLRRRRLLLRQRRLPRIHGLGPPQPTGRGHRRRCRLGRVLAGRQRRRCCSPSVHPSTARQVPSIWSARSTGWRSPPAAVGTGSWPPTAACSPSAGPASTVRLPVNRRRTQVTGMAADGEDGRVLAGQFKRRRLCARRAVPRIGCRDRVTGQV